MNRFIVILFTCIIYNAIQAQPTISLYECRSKAETAFAFKGANEIYSTQMSENLKKLKTNYLPTLGINAQLIWQSEVIELPIKLPGLVIPAMPNDKEQITLDVAQLIYDGGLTSKQSKLEKNSFEINKQSLVVKTYRYKEQVNDVFFLTLLMQEQSELFKALHEELNKRLKSVEAAVSLGAMLPNNADRLKVEILKVKQQMQEIEANRIAGIALLSHLTDSVFALNSVLQNPNSALVEFTGLNAPELELFNLSSSKLDLMRQLSYVPNLPKARAWGQAGYGRPGLNMLSPDFDSWLMVGVAVNIPIFDWNKSKRDRNIIATNKSLVEMEKAAFEDAQKASEIRLSAEIKRLESQLQNDAEIIALCEKITKSAAARLENGTISATEYVTELNIETQARISLKIRTVQLNKAKIALLNLMGKLDVAK